VLQRIGDYDGQAGGDPGDLPIRLETAQRSPLAAEPAGQNDDEGDDPPDPQAAEAEQLESTREVPPGVEPVESEEAQEQGQQPGENERPVPRLPRVLGRGRRRDDGKLAG